MTGSVEIVGLSVALGERSVLDAVDATLPHGALTALVGPNGAGKSTLLRTVCGLLSPLAGSVRLAGLGSVHAMDPVDRARRIAWVPDQADVPFAYTVLETVVLGRFPWHLGSPRRADRDAARTALARMGIEAMADRPLTALSSGERQKAMIARALAGDAGCLLLDEPCAALDVGAALDLLGLLRALAAEGRVVCLTLHDLALARRFAGRVVCLAAGRVAAAGEPAAALAPDVLARVFGVHAAVARTAEGEETLVFSRRPTVGQPST